MSALICWYRGLNVGEDEAEVAGEAAAGAATWRGAGADVPEPDEAAPSCAPGEEAATMDVGTEGMARISPQNEKSRPASYETSYVLYKTYV